MGVRTRKTGEAIKAFIVLEPGQRLTAEELIAWCRDPEGGASPRYRVPKQVEFRDSLPETLVGKVLRRVLLEEERQKREAAKADSPNRRRGDGGPTLAEPPSPIWTLRNDEGEPDPLAGGSG